MSEKTEKVTNEINSEQFNWLTSIPEEYAQVVMKTMQKRNLKLVWHEDQHQYVLTPDDSKKEMEARIKEITRDIESYKEAIENTEGAIVEAERELDEILEACYADELAEQEPFPDAAGPGIRSTWRMKPFWPPPCDNGTGYAVTFFRKKAGMQLLLRMPVSCSMVWKLRNCRDIKNQIVCSCNSMYNEARQ